MNHITRLPKGLKYYVDQDDKKVLDIRATHVCMIPRRLRGVDRILTRTNQVEYIAPDYRGEVLSQSSFSRNSTEKLDLLDANRIRTLKNSFIRRESLIRGIFSLPYSAQMICSGYPDEEIHLPANLHFSWNRKKQKGYLDASQTWLSPSEPIEGVDAIHLPSAESIALRVKRERKAQRIIKKRNARRDYGFIRHMTGSFRY